MKHTIIICIMIFFTCSSFFANAQSGVIINDKTFGTNKAERDVKLLKYNTHLILAGGSGEIGLNGDKTDSSCYLNSLGQRGDNWVLAFDSAFTIMWNYSLGGTYEEVEVNSLFKSSEGKIIFSSRSSSDSSCEKSENSRGGYDYWICALDSNGNKVWDKTWGSSGNETGPIVTELTSGNFIAGGSAFTGIVNWDKSAIGYGKWDYWLVKFDSTGQKIWDKAFGGSEYERSFDGYFNCLKLLPIPDDQLMLFGGTNSPIGGTVTALGYGDDDAWIVEIDTNGNQIWDKRYGGSGKDLLVDAIQVQDGYIAVGISNSPISGIISDSLNGGFDLWVLKLDSAGNHQWNARYGGSLEENPVGILQAPDGGYWISAYTTSPVGNDITEPSYGGKDYWMLKIDSVGNKLWDKRFGGPGDDYASNFVIMPDSSIYLCGSADSGTSAVKTDAGKGASDYWVVHFNYYNNSVGVNEIQQQNSFELSPNPALDYIEIKGNFNADTEVNLYDLQGQVLQRRKSGANRVVVDVQSLVTGMYLIELKSNKGRCIQKLIKR